MTKRIYILATLALALLLTSCGKEPAGNPGGEPESNNALSFTYKSYRNEGTRAIAKDYENVIHDLDIFAFLDDETYIGQLAEGSDYIETDNGDNASTVTATPSFLKQYAGRTVIFYFVGNNKASNDFSTLGTAKHISTFSGTKSQFEELLTNLLGSSEWWPHEKAEYFQITPTSGALLMTGRTAPIPLVGKRQIPVSLKRRMARFDLVNPKPENLKIAQIFISDAMTQGAMFADAVGPHTITARSIEAIDGPGIYDNKHITYDTDGRAAGLFYLYPTSMAVTSITIKGIINEKEVLFNVKGGDIAIDANCRYTLVFDEDAMDFILNSGGWDDGGDIGVGR